MNEKVILLVEDNPDDEALTPSRAFQKIQIRNELVVAHDGDEAINWLFGTGSFQGATPARPPR